MLHFLSENLFLIFFLQTIQEPKRFPEGIRLGPFPLPIEVRNLLEHGNIEGRQDSNEEQQQQQQEAKPFPEADDQSVETENNFPIPVHIRNFIHRVIIILLSYLFCFVEVLLFM